MSYSYLFISSSCMHGIWLKKLKIKTSKKMLTCQCTTLWYKRYNLFYFLLNGHDFFFFHSMTIWDHIFCGCIWPGSFCCCNIMRRVDGLWYREIFDPGWEAVELKHTNGSFHFQVQLTPNNNTVLHIAGQFGQLNYVVWIIQHYSADSSLL